MEQKDTEPKNAARKYTLNQKVRIKTNNGPHKEPPAEAKGASGTIAVQSTSDWLENSEIAPAELPRSYYVELEGGATVLVGEDWLEAPEYDTRRQ